MGYFVIITGMGGFILYSFLKFYFIFKNSKHFSENLPQQVRTFRIIVPFLLALPMAGIFALLTDKYFGTSGNTFYMAWSGFYIVWYIIWRIFAKHSITDWFVPFRPRPTLPIKFLPRNPAHIIALIVFIILMLLLIFETP